MTAEMEQLIAQVKANTDVEASAAQAIKGIAQQLEAAKEDPTAVNQAIADLKASADVLAAAIPAGTSAAPAA
jgi:prefoldin subunit 5